MFKSAFALGLFTTLIVAKPLLHRATTRPLVDLGYAQYQGNIFGDGVAQYLGMRFAQPPVGELRFSAPTEPLQTSGVQDASAFGPICLGINVPYPSATQSDDCLFVNVWAPVNATILSKLPVWLFIQGGGYTQNSNPNYNGTEVVGRSGRNIVMVNFNYRVGAFGFLASEKVRQQGALNAGLLDQRMVMQWIKRNIALFGGDPNHVVIHGASAGAGSVAMHLLAFGGRNDHLFVAGIGESVFFPTQPKVFELEWQFERYVNSSGCLGHADEISCLRSQNISTLQGANVGSPYPGHTGYPLFYWTPTVDGDFLQDYPYKLFEQGKFIKVPVMIGADTNDGSYFANNAATMADASFFHQSNYPNLTTNDIDTINAHYPLMTPVAKHNPYFPSLSEAYGESTFTCPGLQISTSFAQYFNPLQVWNYHFNVVDATNTDNGLGVPHTFEIPAIFGPVSTSSSQSSFSTYNAAIVPIVMNYWISFVRDLDPNPRRAPQAPYWEPFLNVKQRLLLEINSTRIQRSS